MIKLIKKFKYDVLLISISILISIIFTSNYAILKIKGNSMAPTYTDGQFVILKKHKKAKLNDLIVFTPSNWDTGNYKLIKRITGTYEDEIYIDKEYLTVNEIKQQHFKYQCQNLINTERIFVNQNEFIVEGDNKNNSNDSIYHYCLNNENFKVKKEDVYMIGTEFYVLGGSK